MYYSKALFAFPQYREFFHIFFKIDVIKYSLQQAEKKYLPLCLQSFTTHGDRQFSIEKEVLWARKGCDHLHGGEAYSPAVGEFILSWCGRNLVIRVTASTNSVTLVDAALSLLFNVMQNVFTLYLNDREDVKRLEKTHSRTKTNIEHHS